ncbi:Cu(I)-responsive transcriptional regulator [Sphingobium sp.]|uniref:Cu(I)-responsive transcriptional regulator n=1 Tax=Sphingobium sp. TaxID=1912891 RepID=UPI002E24B1B2
MNIGEASKAVGVSERMIRHYEKIKLLPRPERAASGYRVYAPEDLARLSFVAKARDLGFPIEEIRTLLGLWSNSERSSAEVKQLALHRAAELEQKAHAIEALRDALLALAERCHGDDRPDCPIIDGLAS